jgi:RimJ/RimL family protein N-acetyltransferase
MKEFSIVSSKKASILDNLINGEFSKCFPRGFLHGNPVGVAFINSEVNPTTAILWNNSEFFLYGDPLNSQFNSNFIAYYKETIQPEQIENPKSRSYTIVYESQWKSMIPHLFANPMPDSRIHLEFPIEFSSSDSTQKLRIENLFDDIKLPDEYFIHKVDNALLLNSRMENLDYLRKEILDVWGNQDFFLEHGFGVCISYEGKIIARILSEANPNSICEIGIETEESHQRKGLAFAMTKAIKKMAQFLQYNRLEWDCWKTNIPSYNLAKKGRIC